MLRIFVTLLFLLATGGPAFAQELTPPPPPPEIDENPQSEEPEETIAERTTPLSIISPSAGQTIGTSTIIEGTAPAGKTIELRLDGELEKRMRVDGSNRFTIAVSGLSANAKVRVEVLQFDDNGEMETSTSIMVRTGDPSAEIAPPPPKETAEPVQQPEQVERAQPVEASTEQEIRAPVSQGARGALEVAGGTGLGFVGALTGLITGAMIGLLLADGDGDFEEIGYVLWGTIIGYGIGVPAGVITTGYLLDGDGSILLTTLATWGGIVLGGLVAVPALEAVGGDNGYLLLTVATLIGATSGAVVYELTSPPSRRAAKAESQGITITPTLSPTSRGRGMVIGLGGTF